MKLDVVAAEGVYAELHAQQEGAYVMVISTVPKGEDREDRIDVILTPDQAESLSFALSKVAQEARKYGAEEAD